MATTYQFDSPEAAYAEAERLIEKARSDNAIHLDLTSVPESLGRLVNLETLHLHNNQLTSVPESLVQLTNLESLYLSSNQLTSVPESLGQLVNLQVLDFYSNQLTSVPESLGQLVNLESLNLNSNHLTSVPESLEQLVNLQELRFADNHLTSVPESLGQLVNLVTLGLYNNQLTSLPDFFHHLLHLESLIVAYNPLESLPESIAVLTELRWLNCEGCRLKGVSSRVLESIEKGDILKGEGLIGWVLHGNKKLGLPPEILGPTFNEVLSGKNQNLPDNQKKKFQTPKRIARYLRQIQGGKAPRLNEAKLLVVGPGGAGKSSIIEQLVDHTFTKGKPSTHGVVVRDWELCQREDEPVMLNVWDFGGQELQHSTHEFFMTERSVYILVFNPREDQSAQSILYYWLELIQMIAPDAPIIVALSRQDEFRGHVSDAQELMRTYPIVDFILLSCDENHETYANFETLRSLIETQVLGLDHVSNRLPPAWMKVKRELVDTNDDFLAYSAYQTLCRKHSVEDPEDQELLA